MRRVVVYALLGAFFAGEGLLRQGGPAASLRAEQSDRESTRAVGRAFVISILALLAAPLLDARRVGTLPRPRAFFRTGVAAMIAGLAIRVWAMRALGAAYTRTLRLVEAQRVVQEGPYRLIRHPGYLGTLLVWLGAAVALANGLVMPLVGLAMLRAYSHRMRAEEAMLAETFGADYAAYMRRTWRLVPFVY
jgi:protein-S-isoprenylcysteine O-methyltransferase Ste14